MTPAIGLYRASVAFSFAHSTLLAGYGRIVGYSETGPASLGWTGEQFPSTARFPTDRLAPHPTSRRPSRFGDSRINHFSTLVGSRLLVHAVPSTGATVSM